ncbi:hypothetical protein [Myxococcus faecalis]|uniref:hypothetical protein n=1 Tax=Myxococcus faecalis TaxID=3115646 RepID=UPI003CEFA64E
MLNAFRHHGEQRTGRLATDVGIYVLNAFRHHGERRHSERLTFLGFDECSAPSGITASGGRTAPPRGVPNQGRCSTPSGITASGGIPVE